MSSVNSESAHRRVWVLMFDHLDLKDSSQIWSSPAFADLELQATFFEQYLLQDVRASACRADILGSQERTNQFCTEMLAAGKSTGLLRIVGAETNPDAADAENRLSPQNAIRRNLHEESASAISRDWQSDPRAMSILQSDLVWIDAAVTCDEESPNQTCRVLELVQQLRTVITHDDNLPPILIVSVFRGTERTVAGPFLPGFSESRVHVPLWIDTGVPEACRVQAIAGSFDLLSTIAELLTGRPQHPAQVQAAEDVGTDDRLLLRRNEMSMVSLCNAPREMPDRIIKLTSDHWIAARTQEFLLVRPARAEIPDQPPGSETSQAPRLYLKPDDLWNVNDVIVTYAAVAEELGRV